MIVLMQLLEDFISWNIFHIITLSLELIDH